MSKRYVAYCMTRNLYEKVVPSLNSLLENTKVNKVFLLIEDDDIGFKLPGKVKTINVSNQQFFPPDGKNYNCRWTYMSMMRIPLCKIFPKYKRILTLDIDTIVDADISDLWDINLDGYYYAAVPEPAKSRKYIYTNGGVVLWNLESMRDGKCDHIIDHLNRFYWNFPDQECTAQLCRDHIYSLPSDYNVCEYTEHTDNPKIYHFACEINWFVKEPLVQKYKVRKENKYYVFFRRFIDGVYGFIKKTNVK